MDFRSLKTNRAILLFTLFISSTQSFSKDWTQFGVRPLGMGNAFVAVADDFNALYYNPAGLARIKDWGMEIVNPKVDVSTNTYFLSKHYKSKTGNSTVADSIQLIEDEAGKPNHVGFGITPYFIAPGWGFGLTSNTYVNFTAHRNVDLDTVVLSTLTIPVSYARNFLSNQLSVGATIKLVGEEGIDEDISMDTISLITSKNDTQSGQKIQDYIVSGAGVGLDLGVLYTPNESAMEPTFGMNIMDLGGTQLRKLAKSGTKAPNITPTINTGFSLKPYKSERQYILLALDTHAINTNSHFSHKLNLGLEWGLYKILKIQAGLMSGYATAGLQFDVKLFKLRLATYAVDRSAIVGLDKHLVDRRVILQLKILI